MKAEDVAGNTSWSELNFERFFDKLAETDFGNQMMFLSEVSSQGQAELYSFQFPHESQRKMPYLNLNLKGHRYVLWGCNLDI